MVSYNAEKLFNFFDFLFRYFYFFGVFCMPIYAYKELVPIIYNENSLRTLHFSIPAGKECFTKHWHSRIEFLRVTKGSLSLFLNEHKHIISSGELAIIPPDTLHRAETAGKAVEYHVLIFDIAFLLNGTSASKNFLNPLLEGEVTLSPKTNRSDILKVADSLYESNQSDTPPHPLQIVAGLYQLIGLLFQYCTQHSSLQKPQKNLNNIIEYIHQNYLKKELTTALISDYFGYNESYFCRYFKKLTGLSVTHYITVLRLELAQNLLKNSDEEIKMIAVKCAFSDATYFSYSFKKLFGMTPNQFRKSHKNG